MVITQDDIDAVKIPQKGVLIFDLETDYNVDIFTAKIRLFGDFSYKTNKESFTNNLSQMRNSIDSHNILVGHNIREFDCPIIEKYGVSCKNKTLIDTLEIAHKRREYLGISPVESISLAHLAQKFNLSVQKQECDLSILATSRFQDLTQEQKDVIADYLKHDVLTTKALFEYFHDYFKEFILFLPEKDNQNYCYLTSSIPTIIYKMICHKCNLPEVYSEKHSVTIKGGYVKQPTVECLRGKIVCLDVKSSYPHAMIQGNLFSIVEPDYVGPVFEANAMFPMLRNRYKADNHGEIEKFIQFMYDKRVELKKSNDRREYLYKILLNSLYGASGNPAFTSIFNENRANDITYIARVFVKTMAEELEKVGLKVVYQDTDSAYFLNEKNWSDEDIVKFADSVADKIKSYLPFPSKTFSYGLDYKIKYLQFFKDEAGEMKKKHYLFVTEDGKVIIKGIALKKRNSTALSKKVFDVLKPQIVEKLDCHFSKDYINKLIKKFIEENISVLAQRFVVKSTRSYKNSSQLQSQIATMYGRGRHYLIKNKKIGAGKGIKYCTVEQAQGLKFEDLDLDTVWSELSHFITEQKTMKLGDFCEPNK